MRVGYAQVPQFGAATAIEAIRHADVEGLDAAWITDQPLYLDPYALAAAAAAVAPRIQLGIAVTNPFTMHPVLIARMSATVAELSGGRFVLGLGTGNRREMVLPLGSDGRRGVERCRDAVDVIRRLLRGETVDHDRGFVADHVRLSFTPALLPLYVAGLGPRILEMAGQFADGVIINLASSAGLRFALETVDRGRAKRDPGHPADEFPVVSWAVALATSGGDATEYYDRVRPFVAHLLAPTSDEFVDGLRIPAAVARSIRETYAESGPVEAARHVSDELVDHLCWIGSRDQLAERLVEVRESGATEAVALSFFCKSPQEELDLISALAAGRPSAAPWAA